MRVVVDYFGDRHPPLLQLAIHDAPHRRMHLATIQEYRKVLHAAMAKVHLKMPIAHPIDLNVLFVNPSSPDLGNVYLALERAMDGKTMKRPFILEDDSLISKVIMSKYYPQGEKR